MIRHAPAPTAVVRVTGEDAASFLQGQCTADLRKAALTDALWLNRKGRVLAHTVVAKETDGSFLLLCPHLTAEETIAIVTANVIADDVVAADETSAWGRMVVWGSEPSIAGAKPFPTRRFGVEAWDVLTPAGAAMPGEAGRREELEALRVRAGVPAVPADCGANEFPQECGLEAWVSYAKGCYLGQEVMARIQSMGSLRRILRRVTGPVAVGQELKTPEGKVVGIVRSAAGDVGLALVSVDLTEGLLLGSVRIGAPAQMPAR
ncbi:MAG: YgfZ/GcvT domain-containing protein [Opitutales bacterium]